MINNKTHSELNNNNNNNNNNMNSKNNSGIVLVKVMATLLIHWNHINNCKI